MELNYKEIGLRIKEARAALGISQKTLGEEVGLSTTAIALFESGEREIKNLDTLNKMAMALKVSLKELIEGYEQPPFHFSFRASRDAIGNPKFKKALSNAIKRANDELRGK